MPLLRPPASASRSDRRPRATARRGAEIVINAGYRCPVHNREVGGVLGSEHTRGLAADIRLPGLSLQRMYEFALEVPQFAAGGIGVYDEDFLHVDVRDHRARWARVEGQDVGIHELVREHQLLAENTDENQAG
jgi:Peptidase M15